MSVIQVEDFAKTANTNFELSLGETSMTLTLVDIKPMKAQPFPGMLRQPFSLIFRSATPLVLPQRIYRLTNAATGPMDIFLVPIGRDAQGVSYQAVYN